MKRLFTLAITLLSTMLINIYDVNAIVGQQDRWKNEFLSGSVALQRKKYVESEQHLIDSLELSGGNTKKLLSSLEALETLYEEVEDYTKEESVLLAQCYLLKQSHSEPVAIGKVYTKLGALNSLVGCFPESEFYYEQAVSHLKVGIGLLSTPVGMALNNLGWAEFQLQKFDEAENHLRQALYIHSKVTGTRSVFYGLTATNLAELYVSKDRPTVALMWYEKACEALRSSLGEQNSLTKEVQRRYEDLRRLKTPIKKNIPNRSPNPINQRLNPDIA